MRGIVKDGEGGYVKAAVVSLRKLHEDTEPQISESPTLEGSEVKDDDLNEEVTYTLTDENGNFIIDDLDQGGNYILEVFVNETNKIKYDEGLLRKTDAIATEDGDDEKEDESDDVMVGGYEEEETDDFDKNIDDQLSLDGTEEDNAEFFYDVPKDPEVSETFACNVIKPNRELESKLYTLKSNMW